jgi:hypothetical protein
MLDIPSLGDSLLMLTVEHFPDRRSRRDGKGRHVKVSDLMSLFGPLHEWPSPNLVMEVYARDWLRTRFMNEGQSYSLYRNVRIHVEESIFPRVIHFAYRSSSTDRWRMYGSVEIWKDKRRLVHFYGNNQNIVSELQNTAFVETRFGENRCEFCLASLHRFSNKLLDGQEIGDKLRFTA